MELRSKSIKLVKDLYIKNNKRQNNAAITTAYAETTITVDPFPQDTQKMISREVKKWVNELRESSEAGKPIVIKYGSQYNNNRKSNKLTKKKNYQDEA